MNSIFNWFCTRYWKSFLFILILAIPGILLDKLSIHLSMQDSFGRILWAGALGAFLFNILYNANRDWKEDKLRNEEESIHFVISTILWAVLTPYGDTLPGFGINRKRKISNDEAIDLRKIFHQLRNGNMVKINNNPIDSYAINLLINIEKTVDIASLYLPIAHALGGNYQKEWPEIVLQLKLANRLYKAVKELQHEEILASTNLRVIATCYHSILISVNKILETEKS